MSFRHDQPTASISLTTVIPSSSSSSSAVFPCGSTTAQPNKSGVASCVRDCLCCCLLGNWAVEFIGVLIPSSGSPPSPSCNRNRNSPPRACADQSALSSSTATPSPLPTTEPQTRPRDVGPLSAELGSCPAGVRRLIFADGSSKVAAQDGGGNATATMDRDDSGAGVEEDSGLVVDGQ